MKSWGHGEEIISLTNISNRQHDIFHRSIAGRGHEGNTGVCPALKNFAR
jgi:hypothetical protein